MMTILKKLKWHTNVYETLNQTSPLFPLNYPHEISTKYV